MNTAIYKDDFLALEMLEKELGISLKAIKSRKVKAGYLVQENTITKLYLDNLQLETVPKSLVHFKKLTFLSLADNVLQSVDLPFPLVYLTTLDLSGNNIVDLNFINCIPNIEDLYLQKNLITDPSALSGLKRLQTLNLGNNLCKNITQLTGLSELKKLDMYNNKLVSISGIEELKNLEEIDFMDNRISDLTPLTHLPSVTELSLSFNRIKDIKPLSTLISIENLDLMYNVVEDIEGIKNLSNLKILDLRNNAVKDLSALGNLRELTTLHLGSNPLASINVLSKLVKLSFLNLSRSLPSETGVLNQLSQLTSLNLSNNDLEDISFVSHLNTLKRLDVRNNQLKSVECISMLSNLQLLNLESNKIKRFPRWLLTSGMEIKTKEDYGDGYVLHNNPIEDVPHTFLKQSNEVIDDYLKSLADGSHPINEIKVIILGEGAAGKTSLVNFLEGKAFNKNQSQTHGINIAQCSKDQDITMKIWDFGGQDIMHHTHQLFLTQNSLYVIVLNAREKSDSEKWLKLVKVFGGDSPVIILTNKIDENPSEHENIKFLDTKYPNLKGRYARISCQTGEGLEEFRILLNRTIEELLHVRTEWGNSWIAVKKELEKMRRGNELKDYIHYDVYQDLCENAGVYPNHQDTLINWLHELGVVTYFPDSKLSETNVINPSWLTEAFYSIINARLVADNFGKFSLSDLGRILNPKKHPKHKYSFLLGLMSKFELCYQIDDDDFLIPDLLRKEEPEFFWDGINALKFKFKYFALLPKALLPKFMVRRHKEIHKQLNWRTGMVIYDRVFQSYGLIKVDEEDKELSIQVNGDDKRGYLSSILSTFKNINTIYEGLEYEELVPCTCRKCKRAEKPHYFKYSLLLRFKQNGRASTLCEISFQDVLVNELLGILIKPEELEKEISSLIGSGSFLTKSYLETGQIECFIDTIKSLFSSVSYLLFEKSEKAYHLPLFLILRSIFGNKAKADEIQSKGRSDIILNLDNYVYIFELKLDGSSEAALSQIYQNKYYEPYLLERKPIELIAINFSSTERNIESYLYEHYSQ